MAKSADRPLTPEEQRAEDAIGRALAREEEADEERRRRGQPALGPFDDTTTGS